MKMEPIESSETSASNTQTPGIYPKESGLQKATCSTSKFGKNGVYQSTYPTCFKKYIGQTDQPFHVRFRELYRDYKYANNKSTFAHVLEEGHSFSSINEIMDTLHIAKKGRPLDTVERLYIFKETYFG